MTKLKLPLVRGWLVCIVILGGLTLDQQVQPWGQPLTNALVWAALLAILWSASPLERVSLIACVLISSVGEIFCSLIWGLYRYRLDNVPLFVPPGHALLFLLGTVLAARLSDRLTWAVPLLAAPFVVLLGVTGIDTMGPPLFAVFLLCMVFGPGKKLYATMFVLSAAMEIYGTWIGNWTWQLHVPVLGWSTINPPLAAGTFYCVLDLLVTATRNAWERRRSALSPLGAELLSENDAC